MHLNTTKLKVEQALKKYGKKSLSFSCIQDDLNYFFFNDGFIAYKKSHIFVTKPLIAVLGDPICSRDDLRNILLEFIKQFKNIYFIQISEETKIEIKQLNFKIFAFGPEYYVKLDSYSISWKNTLIKKSISYIEQKNINFEEIKQCNTKFWEKFKRLQTKWQSQKKYVLAKHGFLNRPLINKEKDVRFFVLKKNNKLINFIRCDPMYDKSKIYGYSISYMMYDPTIKKNNNYGLIHFIIQTMKKENISVISLGVAPFGKANFEHTIISKITQKLLYYLGTYFYNFSHLEKTKKKLSKNTKLTYFASKNTLPIIEILNTYCITTGLLHNDEFNA